MKSVIALTCLLLLGSVVSRADADVLRSKDEVKARLDAFNLAWMERDKRFIRDFYAHDENMLLFFERRQLHGFDDRSWSSVETDVGRRVANRQGRDVDCDRDVRRLQEGLRVARKSRPIGSRRKAFG